MCEFTCRRSIGRTRSRADVILRVSCAAGASADPNDHTGRKIGLRRGESMRFYICLACALACPAWMRSSPPDAESRISSLLAVLEPLPDQQSGEILFTSRVVPAPGQPAEPSPGQRMEYQYKVDGNNYLVRITDRTETSAANQTLPTIYCSNSAYYFVLHKWSAGWVLSTVKSRLAIVGVEQTYWSTFAEHLAVTHSIHGKPLSGLITDLTYAVTIRQEGPGVYHVSGGHSDVDADGLRDFSATVHLASSGMYAYITRSTATVISTDKSGQGKWRTQIGIQNTVQEGVNRPTLLSSIDSRREQHGDDISRTEYHTAFTTRPAVTEEEMNEFYLSYYGLPEPTLDEGPVQSADPRTRYAFLWCFR